MVQLWLTEVKVLQQIAALDQSRNFKQNPSSKTCFKQNLTFDLLLYFTFLFSP